MKLADVSKEEYESVTESKYSSLFSSGTVDENVQYVYYDDTTTIGWTNNKIEEFDPGNVSKTTKGQNKSEILTIVYTVESPHHVLKDSELAIIVPDLELKREYARDHRFKMADYFGYFVSTKVELISGTQFKCTLTPFDQVVLYEHMTKHKEKPGLDAKMGKGNICTRWVTKMKGRTVFYQQQLGYKFTEGKALQLNKLSKPKSLLHRYEFDLHIRNHINMQKFNPLLGDYEDIVPNMEYFEGSVSHFAQPTLYGHFSKYSILGTMSS